MLWCWLLLMLVIKYTDLVLIRFFLLTKMLIIFLRLFWTWRQQISFKLWQQITFKHCSIFQKTVDLIIYSLYFAKYIHSPTCDHTTSDERKLRAEFPCAHFDSDYYKVSLKLYYFATHFELYAQTVDYHNVHYLYNEKLLFASHSTCWWVYIPPHFVFLSYDQVFRTYAVRKSGIASVHYAVTKVFPTSLKIVIRSIGSYHVFFRCLQDGVLLRNLNLIFEVNFKQAHYWI